MSCPRKKDVTPVNNRISNEISEIAMEKGRKCAHTFIFRHDCASYDKGRKPYGRRYVSFPWSMRTYVFFHVIKFHLTKEDSRMCAHTAFSLVTEGNLMVAMKRM